MQQVAVRRVQLDKLETKPKRPTGAADEGFALARVRGPLLIPIRAELHSFSLVADECVRCQANLAQARRLDHVA
jgi:hypothetical protein